VVSHKTVLHALSVASAVAVVAGVDVAKAVSVQSAAATNPAKVVKPPQPWQPTHQVRPPSVVNVVSVASAVDAMSVAQNVPDAQKKATAKMRDAQISKPLKPCPRRKQPADWSKARSRPPAASVHRKVSARSQVLKAASASQRASKAKTAITAMPTKQVKRKPLPSHASPTSAPLLILHL
jgi:hypothetical protein